MPWETRRKGRFYYRSRRENGRPIKQYLGRGPAAARAAAAIETKAAERLAEQKAIAEFTNQMEPGDRALDGVDRYLEMLTEGTLLASGYREHKGSWRKTRVNQES
jgi:hypothetical protein